MTISSSNNRNQYTANGTNTTFTYNFKVFASTDLSVYVNDVLQTSYSLIGVGNDAGGSVVFTTAPANATIVTIVRNEPFTQEIDYVEGDAFPADAHEEGLDRSVLRDLTLKEQIDRALKLPVSSTASSLLPNAEAGKLLGWNDTENGLENKTASDDSTFLVTATGSTASISHADRWGNNLSVKDFGAVGNGVTDDTTAIQAATASGLPLFWPSGTYLTNSLSLTNIIKSDNAIIKIISNRTNDIANPLCNNEIIGTLTIQGNEPTSLNVISASIVSQSTFSTEYYNADFRNAKYQFVDILLSGSVEVGNMLLIKADQEELSGCFEVISTPTSNTARVLMLAQGTLTVSSFTGVAKVIQTILQYNNITMINVGTGYLNLKNIGFLGACYPVTNGNRGNVYDPAGGNGGVSGIISRNGALVQATNCGISGVSGTQLAATDSGEIDWSDCYVSCGGRNGISASDAKITFGDGVASQNLLDNIITQDNSWGFCKFASSAHAGRHGLVATNSSINITGGFLLWNGFLDPSNGDGLSALSSNITAIDAQIYNNSNCGIEAIGNSDVRATNIDCENNDYGLIANTSGHILATGVIDNNTTTDVRAINGGKIEIIGATYSTTYPDANKTDGTGALVQTSSTIPSINANDGIIVGGEKIKRLIVKRVASVNFPSITSLGVAVLSVTVEGVVVADNSIVSAQIDFTADRAGLIFEAKVSADDTIEIACNNVSSATIDPPALSFNIFCVQF